MFCAIRITCRLNKDSARPRKIKMSRNILNIAQNEAYMSIPILNNGSAANLTSVRDHDCAVVDHWCLKCDTDVSRMTTGVGACGIKWIIRFQNLSGNGSNCFRRKFRQLRRQSKIS